MNNMLEISIIIFCGLAAAGFILWYFFINSRKSRCGSCACCHLNVKKTCSSQIINQEPGGKNDFS